MLVARTVILNHLNKQFTRINNNNEEIQKILAYIVNKYAIPKGYTVDFITGRTSVNEGSDFILYTFIDAFDEIEHTKVKYSYFTDDEIKRYTNIRYEEEKIQFPIIIPCVQVTFDQWIGTIPTKTLMLLKKAQLIRYNEKTQRTMTRIIRGEEETFQITINKRQVEDIKEAYRKEIYIPDTITLNFAQNPNNQYHYDAIKREMVIESLEFLDITDGYHRYLGIDHLSNDDPNWEYPMELRLTDFSEEKASQFIWQSDQKTKMSKITSQSMNTTNPANIVVNRVNDSMKFYLKGSIKRNGGQINFAYLTDIVGKYYFPDRKADVSNARLLQVSQEIVQKFNRFIEEDSTMIDHMFTYTELAVLFYIFQKDVEEYMTYFKMMIKKVELKKIRSLVKSSITKSTLTTFDRIWAEIMDEKEV